MDICLEKGKTHLAHRRINIRFREFATAAQLVKYLV
jgi:hypothetical protein